MTCSVVVIADDLTGAIDTVHGFAARDYVTAVVAVPPIDGRSNDIDSRVEILGVNTDSRYAKTREAATAVHEAITLMSAEVVYKKVDSTLRGNLSAEIDAALTASRADFALVAPAFPSIGRTTVDGLHCVDGVPVAETEYGTDSKGPSSSVLSDLFSDLERRVETIPIDVVEAGRERVSEEFARYLERSDDAPVFLCDARSSSDLATLALAGSRFETLYVGSGGLAEDVPVPESTGQPPSSPEVRTGVPLAVVGSANQRTLTQVAHVPRDHVIALDSRALLEGPASEDAATRTIERLERERPVVLTTATNREDVEITLKQGYELGLTQDEVGERVAAGLAATAATVFENASVSGLLYTGGETAVAGLRALDTRTVRLTGESVETGIPVGYLGDGSGDGTPLVTKAGGFGSPEAINNCLETLLPRT